MRPPLAPFPTSVRGGPPGRAGRPRRVSVVLTAALVTALAFPGAAAAAVGVPTDPADGVPRTDPPISYSKQLPISDPGAGSANYFQPYWYDTDGRHIQAHGGQIVTTQENGKTVYYWYGEDRTKGYYDSPGVAAYRSEDGHNWTNMGTALRSVAARSDLQSSYFDQLYDTVDDNGAPRTARIDELNYHLNTTQSADYTAIFERPKVLHNTATGKWVMWWHSDGRTEPGGSTYARSFAAVAVADSPAGPFKLIGAYRLYNRQDYQACTNSAVPGQARDMTVFQDKDGAAYIAYSSEENRSLYIAKLNADYTNVEHTSTAKVGSDNQYSESGQFPYVFADGTANAPVRGVDFQIVKECGMLEAPAVFEQGGIYHVIASGATGWAPNPQTYYTASSLLGSWVRGVKSDDAYEGVAYNSIPEGGDGLLSVGDSRRTTFGSQSTNVFQLAPGKFVYMGDRWNDGAANSTYVWLPITTGEGGSLQMRNPAVEDPAKWGNGWDESYWDNKGAGVGTWTVTDARLPASIQRGSQASTVLPATVAVKVDGTTGDVPVTWSTVDTSYLGTRTITGTLAADATFTAGRTFTRTIEVTQAGVANVAPAATVSASSRTNLVAGIVDGDVSGKAWDDWAANGSPRDSWLSFDWSAEQPIDSIVVHTYKDGATATWPSKVEVQVKDATGAWVDSGVSATVAQDASTAAPVVTLDGSTLPKTTAIRLRLTSVANTWQSIAEVQIWGKASSAPVNVCRVSGATVSASFSQTEWATLPARNACDGNPATSWSTWTGGTPKDTATFTLQTPTAHRMNSVSFTTTEGTLTSVKAEYQDAAGQWQPTSLTGSGAVITGTPTTLNFSTVVGTGLRLTFSTPGSFLKIPEIVVPEASEPVSVTATAASDGGATADGWHHTPVSVTLTADKAEAAVQYRTNGTGDWTAVAGPVVVSTDGTTTVNYRAVRDGNPVDGSEGSIAVKLDRTAPVSTVNTDPASGTATAGQTVSATFAATDATSGVDRTEYSTDAGATWTAGSSVSFTAVGQHAVQYRSVDKAGVVETARTVTLTVTEAGPTATATTTSSAPASADGWYHSTVLVSLAAPQSGQKVQYRVNGGTWRSYSSPISVSTNGTSTIDHRLLVNSVLVAGSTAQTVVKVDRQVPTVSAARTPASGTGTPRNPINVRFTGADTVSGVEKVEYRLNSGEWVTAGADPLVVGQVGNWLVSYRSVDHAGNVSSTRSLSVVVVADPATTVKASVKSAKPGTWVTVTAAGFHRFTEVRLTFAGQPLTAVLSDVNGTAKVTVQVPADAAAGAAAITAGDGTLTASTSITVTR